MNLLIVLGKLFVLLPSSAASERTFSIMRWMHSKSRNKLNSDRLSKMMFIRTNNTVGEESSEDITSDEEEEEDADI